MKSRTEIFREVFAEEAERNKSIHAINSEYRRLLEFVRSNEAICAQEQDDDVSLASVLIRYIESLEAEFNAPLHCDYCKAVVDDPWHGSGSLNGEEQRHIHACEKCRHLLPVHGMKYVWCNIAGDAKDGGFSDSWNAAVAERAMSLKDIEEFQKKHPDTYSYKLIAYRCLSDEAFEFNHNMKLR